MTLVFVTLIQNAALMLSMMVVFDLVTSRKPVHGKWSRQVLAGVILGVLCIGLMISSFRLETGIIFDTRSVLLSLSGLFIGPLPTVFAMAMAAVYRIWHGGTGVWTGIGVILAAGCIGILWRHYRSGRLANISVRELYGFGVVVHLVMLALMLTLPWEAAKRVLNGIGLPVLLVYPIATIALGWLLESRLKRESATDALSASEARYRNVFEAANVGKSVTLPTGEVDFNQAFCDMLGYSPEELHGKTWQELTPAEQIGPINEFIAPLLRGEKDVARFEKSYIHKNGSHVFADVSLTLQRTDDGLPLHFITTAIDISDYKKAEKALRESEERFRVTQEISPDGFTILHPLRNEKNEIVDFTWVYQNQTIAGIIGTDPEDVVGKRLLDLFPTHKGTKVFDAYIDVTNSKEPQVLTDVYVGEIIAVPTWLRLVIVPLQGDIAILSQNITERKQVEQRIKHLNRVLRSIRDVNQLIVRERDPEILIHEGVRLLVENRGYTSALIVLTDDKDQPLSWAPAGIASSSESLNAMLKSHKLPPCCNLIQSTEGTILIDDRAGVCEKCPIHEKRQEAVSLCARLIHGGSYFGYITAALERNLKVDDEELNIFSEMAEDLAYALNFSRIEAAHESSKKKRESLEGQLIQAQKMESVGRLAGGVAHDYNNISSIIIGYSELALEMVEQGAPLYDDLMEIYTAAKRSTNITRQLLAFARQQTIAPKVLDLNDIIGNMLKMLRRLIGEDIDLAWLPGSEVWPVKMDSSQVDQILANLCVNARDAIADVGKVTIETENISFDEDYCADHEGFVPGEYVSLTVSDDGCGIPPESLDKIFEPFFTSKGQGKGTGLGLSTVYGIVKQNAGFINVYSEPDNGTSIKIYLPRHEGQVVEAHSEDTIEIPVSRKGELVLLVEDNASILKLGKRILEDLGYMVLPANSPEEAIKLAEEHKGNIHLLITDVVMPEMNGRELSEQLRTLCPDLKTLYMSGYTANVIAHRGVLEDGVCFMSKPFSKKDMAAMVREVLDEAKTKS